MNGVNLPRGRFSDALVAFTLFISVLQVLGAVQAVLTQLAFSPVLFLAGGWSDPLSWLSPIVSQFLLSSIMAVLFNTVLLLIAGRYVEQALGGVGMLIAFVAGAYGGSLARLVLTPNSIFFTAGADAGLFALIGAYLSLYGVPRVIPVAQHHSRAMQIGIVALIWAVVQLAFMLAGGSFELSVSLINPLAGMATGVLLAKPLLRFRYRGA